MQTKLLFSGRRRIRSSTWGVGGMRRQPGKFGNLSTPLPFSEPTTQLLSRDLAMLRGLRMARIRPSRLRILNAGSKIQIGFTKKSNLQKMFEHVKKSTKTPKSTPHSYQHMLGYMYYGGVHCLLLSTLPMEVQRP